MTYDGNRKIDRIWFIRLDESRRNAHRRAVLCICAGDRVRTGDPSLTRRSLPLRYPARWIYSVF